MPRKKKLSYAELESVVVRIFKVRKAHRRIIAKYGYERRVKSSIPRLPDTEVTSL